MKTAQDLQLFVWTKYSPDYSGGLAFAIARDEAEARRLVIAANYGIDAADWGDLEVHDLKTPIGYSVTGGS